MGDFYREKKEHKPKKDYALWIMIAIIVFTVLFVMTAIFVIFPTIMNYWWAWLNGWLR